MIGLHFVSAWDYSRMKTEEERRRYEAIHLSYAKRNANLPRISRNNLEREKIRRQKRNEKNPSNSPKERKEDRFKDRDNNE